MKSSFCIDLQRFMLIPTKFPLSHAFCTLLYIQNKIHRLANSRYKPMDFLVYVFKIINDGRGARP